MASLVANESGNNRNNVYRYIRLTELVPELLELVDDGRMAFRPAVEISYLTEDEQRDLVETIDSEDCTPSLSQACRMKKLSQEGKLDMDAIFAIMTEEKANQKEKIKIPAERLEKYFSRGTSPAEIERARQGKAVSSFEGLGADRFSFILFPFRNQRLR